jgi:hypothetical protein
MLLIVFRFILRFLRENPEMDVARVVQGTVRALEVKTSPNTFRQCDGETINVLMGMGMLTAVIKSLNHLSDKEITTLREKGLTTALSSDAFKEEVEDLVKVDLTVHNDLDPNAEAWTNSIEAAVSSGSHLASLDESFAVVHDKTVKGSYRVGRPVMSSYQTYEFMTMFETRWNKRERRFDRVEGTDFAKRWNEPWKAKVPVEIEVGKEPRTRGTRKVRLGRLKVNRRHLRGVRRVEWSSGMTLHRARIEKGKPKKEERTTVGIIEYPATTFSEIRELTESREFSGFTPDEDGAVNDWGYRILPHPENPEADGAERLMRLFDLNHAEAHLLERMLRKCEFSNILRRSAGIKFLEAKIEKKGVDWVTRWLETVWLYNLVQCAPEEHHVKLLAGTRLFHLYPKEKLDEMVAAYEFLLDRDNAMPYDEQDHTDDNEIHDDHLYDHYVGDFTDLERQAEVETVRVLSSAAASEPEMVTFCGDEMTYEEFWQLPIGLSFDALDSLRLRLMDACDKEKVRTKDNPRFTVRCERFWVTWRASQRLSFRKLLTHKVKGRTEKMLLQKAYRDVDCITSRGLKLQDVKKIKINGLAVLKISWNKGNFSLSGIKYAAHCREINDIVRKHGGVVTRYVEKVGRANVDQLLIFNGEIPEAAPAKPMVHRKVVDPMESTTREALALRVASDIQTEEYVPMPVWPESDTGADLPPWFHTPRRFRRPRAGVQTVVAYREKTENVISPPRESVIQLEKAPDTGWRPAPKRVQADRPRWVHHSKRETVHTPSLLQTLRVRSTIDDARESLHNGNLVALQDAQKRYIRVKDIEVPLVRQRVRQPVLRKGNIQKLVEPKS